MTSGCRTRHDFRGAVGAVGDTLYSIARIAGGVVTPAVWTRTGLPAARRDRWSWRGSTGRGFSPCRPRFGPKTLGFDARGRLWTLPAVPDGGGSLLDVFSPTGRRILARKNVPPVHGFSILLTLIIGRTVLASSQ